MQNHWACHNRNETVWSSVDACERGQGLKSNEGYPEARKSEVTDTDTGPAGPGGEQSEDKGPSMAQARSLLSEMTLVPHKLVRRDRQGRIHLGLELTK